MTVFFAMAALPFLAVFFALLESARMSGACAQAQNINQMAYYSLFGEYEKALLEDFELFGVDAALGTGEFSTDRLEGHLKHFLELNTNAPDKGGNAFDPWNISIKDTSITSYALLTDDGGDYLYQQAVAFMRKTSAASFAGKLTDFYRQAIDQKEQQVSYLEDTRAWGQALDEAGKEKEALISGAADDAAENTAAITEPETLPEDPLEKMRQIRTEPLLKLVCPRGDISEKRVSSSEIPSGRSLSRGDLRLEKPYSGTVNDLIFREYLLSTLGCCGYPSQREGKLSYELEYMLSGTFSDKNNLQTVLRKLLLLREGNNYLYLLSDPSLKSQASSMAFLLTGWTGIAPLIKATEHVLLLAWAYAESLVDLRTLMEGGKAAVIKTGASWQLKLSDLTDLAKVLGQPPKDQEGGVPYKEHLRLLLNLQSSGIQKKRMLDLIELRLKAYPGLSGFKADHCLIGIKSETGWEIRPLFGRVTQALAGVLGEKVTKKTAGGFAYDQR